MKALLIGLNASYVHTNLAIRLLKAVTNRDIQTLELTINEEKSYILKRILDLNVSHIFWSSYIWNWEIIKEIGDSIYRMELPIKQFVGGPEVSYDMAIHLEENPWIEGILVGEGELVLPPLLEALEKERSWESLAGMAFRKKDGVQVNPGPPLPEDLDYLPSIDYSDEDLSHKIVYYEAMRGCPYDCAYCLSSLDRGVRYRSLDLIKRDLLELFTMGTRQIKFVDRSFSIKQERALNLINFIKERDPGYINFHFEVNLENLDEKIIQALGSARPGLFQIEAGVQSTNQEVLKEIHRLTDIEAIGSAMRKLDTSPIHRHLDLIVGLPGESKNSFLRGFDQVYNMNPERIQVGFLKLLRGTSLRNRAKELGIIYEKRAPYTILKNKELSPRDIISLSYFEEIVETFYDEHVFQNTNRFMIQEKAARASEYFMGLSDFYQERLYQYQIKGQKGKYRLVFDYLMEKDPSRAFYDYLKMDFYLQEDQYIEKVLRVEDKEMTKGQVIAWLKEIEPSFYEEFGKDIHRVARMCRGIFFESLGIERLYFYRDHKYVKHLDRRN